MKAPKTFTRVEVHSGPDGQGRYFFTMYWMDNYFPGHPDGENVTRERGQCFKAPLPAGVTDPRS